MKTLILTLLMTFPAMGQKYGYKNKENSGLGKRERLEHIEEHLKKFGPMIETRLKENDGMIKSLKKEVAELKKRTFKQQFTLLQSSLKDIKTQLKPEGSGGKKELSLDDIRKDVATIKEDNTNINAELRKMREEIRSLEGLVSGYEDLLKDKVKKPN